MIRNIFRSSLLSTRNQCPFVKSIAKSSGIFVPQRYCFSNQQYHPLIQRIISGELTKNPKPIIGQLKTLNSEDRQTALKLILKNVYSHTIGPQTLSDQTFLNHSRKHPQIHIDALLYKIKALISKIDEYLHNGKIQQNKQQLQKIYLEITNYFTECFSEFKKIPREQSLRTGIMLKKRYSDFCLLYMANFTLKPEDKEETLKNICQSYRALILEMVKLINQEGGKVRNAEDTPLSENQSQQEKDFRVNSMKENLKIIIESNSENVLHLMKATVQIYKVNQNRDQYREGVIETVSNIERALIFYNILKDMSVYSIFYLHLKKVKAELNLFYKMTELRLKGDKENEGQEKELTSKFKKQIAQIYKQAEQNLGKIGGEQRYLQNITQTTLMMLSLKMHLIEQAQKQDMNEYKNILLSQVQNILQKISNPIIKKNVMPGLMNGVKLVFKSQEQKRQAKK